MQISISAANWFPLSAVYSYDTNIDLRPTLIEWGDGYRTIHNPLFDYSRDVKSNRQTIFYLTTAGSLFDFVTEKSYDTVNLGAYISLRANNQYITTTNDVLYLSGELLNSNSFFRMRYNQDDGTYSFLQGTNKLVTVSNTLPYALTLEAPLSIQNQNRQRFNVFSPDTSNIYITTLFDNPYPGYGPDSIERFWSTSPTTSSIQAIGIVQDDDYHIENKYIFEVDGYDLVFTLDGLTRDQTWVHYYNELIDKRNNENIELYEERCISGVDINRLVDLPYHSQINLDTGGVNGSFNINLANLKNILTPEYEQNIRTDTAL